MAGPHPPNPIVGADGPAEPEPQKFIATEPAFAATSPDVAAQPTVNYPEAPPPAPTPAAYPPRRSKRLLIGLLMAVALVAIMTAAIVYGVRTNGANTGATLSEGAVKTAIQGYLDALERRDIETVSRNALCGIYDGVRDHRSDHALARATSDAFRKQFSQVEVTSIDKIVYMSQYQAQALFTMRTASAPSGMMTGDMQGVAALLFQRGQIYVCSYVPRDAGPY
jgi:hypothetical protein